MKVPEIELNNITELRKELDSFHTELDDWYFRGQADNTWELRPTIWREDSVLLNSFRTQMRKKHIQLKENIQALLKMDERLSHLNLEIILDWAIRIEFENYLLSNFYLEANKAGLPVSDRHLHLCANYDQKFWIIDHSTEIGSVISSYAGRTTGERINHRIAGPLIFDATLPQHYGLPTRYLDWTSNPRVAEFFAGYEYLKLSHEKKRTVEKIAIYAIKETGIGPVQIEKYHLRYQNKFLHAQGGLFTRIYGDFFYLENGRWPSIEDLYEKYGKEFFELKKYVLKTENVESLMMRLYRQGISISTLMPNYNHVAEQVRNMSYYFH